MRDLLIAGTASGFIGATLVSIFFLMFLALVFWVYRKERRSQYEKISHFPLETGDCPAEQTLRRKEPV